MLVFYRYCYHIYAIFIEINCNKQILIRFWVLVKNIEFIDIFSMLIIQKYHNLDFYFFNLGIPL